MATEATQAARVTQKQIRETAFKHALNIEEKKKLANRVSDLVLAAYDLPSSSDADPANPSIVDAALFEECLSLFRPNDFDELVSERNIDDRCGYALCSQKHRKIPGAGVKTWNGKGGKAFKLLNTADIERWCSDLCGDRAAFVRAQLSSEPAWMRETQNRVRLLDEVQKSAAVDTLAEAVKALAISYDESDTTAAKLQELSLERGEPEVMDVSSKVAIVEKESTGAKSRPPQPDSSDSIEGHKSRRVHFLTNNE